MYELTKAKTIMPCCFQELCTTCFANCIALNSGDETGTTRNQCPFCREKFCEKVVPDIKFSVLLDNYKEGLYLEQEKTYYLTNTVKRLNANVKYLTMRVKKIL